MRWNATWNKDNDAETQFLILILHNKWTLTFRVDLTDSKLFIGSSAYEFLPSPCYYLKISLVRKDEYVKLLVLVIPKDE